MSTQLTADQRERLEDLFDRASALPPEEHAAFITRECAADDPLRAELVRLLGGHLAADVLAPLRPGARLAPGTRIGRYELRERIGEGGMGEVYAAEQLEPVKRRVAVKLIRPGMDSAQLVARFEAERQALARMAHPNVAQVFDGGTADDGRPYFVMEFVEGEPLTEYADRHRLSTNARLELFLAVCDGVQHAHQKGLIHRDLKPSNLLVTQRDGRATPKIIDFGVARATTGRLVEDTLQTMVGQLVGTLDYMSPEQADPSGTGLDTRSDVYSLGVVLYQLLSGLLPFDHESGAGRALSEIQRAIREQDPPSPSTRLRRKTDTSATIAERHAADVHGLVRQLAGDLDWICLKALAKDPDRRYASVSELAQDVRRH
ncbi:MAG: serine/threonine-protein kinase, partial [Planctomycetota bacterium]